MALDVQNLTVTYPPLQQLQQAITTLANYDFRWIKMTNPNWAAQAEIHPDKPAALLSCLFHYKMDTSLVMHYLGGNFTAAHRNVDNIICCILPYVDSNLLQHYHHVMTTRCPNVFNADYLQENFMTYWRHSNNPSIMKTIQS